MLVIDITKVESLMSHLVNKGLGAETIYTVRMTSGDTFGVSEASAMKIRKYLMNKAGEEYGIEETGNI